jgi:hypothetical protein
MEIFEKYNQEIVEDTKIDQLNLLDKQLMQPAVRHKWVARLIKHKKQKNDLERRKKELREEVLKTLEQKGIPTGIPKASLSAKVDSSEAIQKINQEIEDVELLIDYLERVEKIFASLTFDFKNVIEITRQELS